MANIVIWGRARDIVTGDLPPSATVAEVATLAELRQELAETSAALVLADPARIEPDRAELETARRAGSSRPCSWPWSTTATPRRPSRRFPFLDDVLLRPVTASRLRLRLERALDTVHNRRVIRQLERRPRPQERGASTS